MNCHKCGNSNPKNARFCSSCGAGVAVLECLQCNTINQPGSRFCTHCGQSLAASPEPTNQALEQQAERRMLTVLFCDLVESTQFVEGADPEESRSFIRDYQQLAKEVIDGFGGRITEYLGDGIVAQFTRHESNAERAINAALGIIQTLKEQASTGVNPNQLPAVRCGIATGLAIVGDILGDDEIRSESAIGLPLNLAARIQSIAEPNQVMVSNKTHQFARGLFEFEHTGAHTLKGVADQQEIWRVLAKRAIASRFDAHTAELTPMVDRTQVTADLMRKWTQCKQGNPAIVVLSGEAGIGKSRIVQEFAKKIAGESTHVEYQCSPYHTNTAFYPMLNGVEAAAQITHSDDNETRVRKLARLVRWSSDDNKRDMPALMSLLSLSPTDKWKLPDVDPDKLKEDIMWVGINNLASLSKRAPLLLQVEDIHWIDPTTLELVKRLADALKGRPVLLLITTRPGYSKTFIDGPDVSRIEIEKLPEKYMRELISLMQGETNLLKPVADQIVRRTQGVPLFIEELSKSLLERRHTQQNCFESNGLADDDIPGTLHESLLSRIDHLPKESRAIALLSSVIGRDFSCGLLQHISNTKEHYLLALLKPLIDAQLVIQHQSKPEIIFRFKHQMVRDVAYETLLLSERTKIHLQIANCLDEHYPEIIKHHPELPAHHHTKGNNHEKAIAYWLKAGKMASQRYALLEAKQHLTTGLNLIQGLADSAHIKPILLDYLITIGPILIALEGTASNITRDTYVRAVDICRELPKSSKHFAALWGLWQVSMGSKPGADAQWPDKLVTLSEELNKPELNLQARHCQWVTHFQTGNFAKAHDHCKNGLNIYKAEQHVGQARLYGGHDPKICGHGILAHTLWFMGDDQQALDEAQNCYDYAVKLDHTGSILHAVDLNLQLAQYRKETQHIKRWSKKLETLCAKVDLPEYDGRLLCCRGQTLFAEGHQQDGIILMKQGLKELKSISTTQDIPFFTEMLAEALQAAGHINEAISYIERVTANTGSIENHYWHAEILRRKAALLLKNNKPEEALALFKTCIDLTTEQNAISLKLRATISLHLAQKETKGHSKTHEALEKILASLPATNQALEVTAARQLIQPNAPSIN